MFQKKWVDYHKLNCQTLNCFWQLCQWYKPKLANGCLLQFILPIELHTWLKMENINTTKNWDIFLVGNLLQQEIKSQTSFSHDWCQKKVFISLMNDMSDIECQEFYPPHFHQNSNIWWPLLKPDLWFLSSALVFKIMSKSYGLGGEINFLGCLALFRRLSRAAIMQTPSEVAH